MMNHQTREAIGEIIGKTLEVDVEEGELAIGLSLRVKVCRNK
jgi:hypothetical protein